MWGGRRNRKYGRAFITLTMARHLKSASSPPLSPSPILAIMAITDAFASLPDLARHLGIVERRTWLIDMLDTTNNKVMIVKGFSMWKCFDQLSLLAPSTAVQQSFSRLNGSGPVFTFLQPRAIVDASPIECSLPIRS